MRETAMRQLLLNSWSALMDSRRNPLRHLDLASQHYFMQVLGWMWSMTFCLVYLSIFEFGYVWLAHVLVFGAWAFTVSVFREVDLQEEPVDVYSSGASKCIWKLDSEA